MRKTETLNLRVSTDFKRRLIEEAKKERRSVTNYLEATLASVWGEGPSPKRTSKQNKKEKAARA
jgi:hypothetical protein